MGNELNEQNNFIMYTTDDGQIDIEVRLEDENVWLTQNSKAELFDTKDIRNVYVAKQIVEGYDFDRTLGKEEKAALIKSILNSSKLNKGDGYYLTKLIQNLEQIGLSTQEVFGIIINAGIYGTISNAILKRYNK